MIFLDDEMGRRDRLDHMVARAKERNALPTVCAVIERAKDTITFNPLEVTGGGIGQSEAGSRARKLRADLPAVLRRVCIAADQDGFFGANSSELRGWQLGA